MRGPRRTGAGWPTASSSPARGLALVHGARAGDPEDRLPDRLAAAGRRRARREPGRPRGARADLVDALPLPPQVAGPARRARAAGPPRRRAPGMDRAVRRADAVRRARAASPASRCARATSVPGLRRPVRQRRGDAGQGQADSSPRASRELELPEVFPEPRLALDSLNGELEWERDAAGGVHGARRLAHLRQRGPERHRLRQLRARAARGRARIDLSGVLTRADGSAARALPAAAVLPETRARLAGRRDRRRRGERRAPAPARRPARFSVHRSGEGPVPGHRAGGRRACSTTPRAGRASRTSTASCSFERDRMEVVGRSGTILGAKLANVRVALPSLLDARAAAAW